MSADAVRAEPEHRTVVVTGASAGLGYHAAEQLAARGHRVVLAVRDPERGAAAERSIQRHVDGADTAVLRLDLADLDSVRSAATALADHGPVHAVLNNAGVVGSAERRSTAQGFELQVGTNHLGHFAWTALVLPLLDPAVGRVVHLGSIAHRFTTLDRTDPLATGRYEGHRQYARSKLAVMLFGFELAQRLGDAGSRLRSVVAHPGLALDAAAPPRPEIAPTRSEPAWMRAGSGWVAQGKDAGAHPLVHAAVGDGVRSGEYWGPGGPLQFAGPPALVPARTRAHDRTAAARLWAASERATGVAFALDGVL
ncbi:MULTISPECIES: SDR family NAD(P)-dependent oxidoreductase [unclassified Curtobacterium]|uniref:SDR family NAD(P)-dependent oxidoreductase n=1 Tax=unclassified Curtobacterium TaxID=257496 RepID=UPI0008251330|nr:MULTISPECIES: SDR family NAD(P)-dependent oxidoreductase [unclassified Curtobacterium]WIA98684.1 SDR family NAD(P)-dependent oxidoreductase [Curtobacterium sp. MCBA15_012]